ncbi:MAG: response regulator, partial [Candidatus Altiarchaeales archaeon]|nr:response regulator [Candidatus Altiarchaeales archaeon]
MSKKIMIVDDEPDILRSIKQLFEGMDDDYKVTCASSGIQCLKLLENNVIPDLILLDIMMPGM